MKEIKFNHPHRQKHFNLFNGLDQPHFNITGNIEISALLSFLKANQYNVSPGIVYAISRTKNFVGVFAEIL